MTDDCIIDGVRFKDLGRTSKIQEVVAEPLLETSADNSIAKYPLHLHRPEGSLNPGSTAIQISNCVVDGSPGWGFVSHGAHADFTGNIAYNVVGSAFVWEDGDERGTANGNIAMYVYGPADSGNGIKGRLYKTFKGNTVNDIAHQGHGFWTNARDVVFTNNVAVDCFDSSFIWFHRHINGQIQVRTSVISSTVHQEIYNGQDYIDYNRVPLATVTDNVAVATQRGFHFVGARADIHHDIINVLERNTVWDCDIGGWVEYRPKYTFIDFTAYACENLTAHADRAGMRYHNNSQQGVFQRMTLDGWDDEHVFQVGNSFVALGIDDTPDSVEISNTYTGPTAITVPFVNETAAGGPVYTNRVAGVNVVTTDGALVTPEVISWTIDSDQSFSLRNDEGQFISGKRIIVIRGDKNDTIGTATTLRVMYEVREIEELAKLLGHYTLNNRKYVIMIGLICSRLNHDVCEHVVWTFDATGANTYLTGPNLSRSALIAAHKSHLGTVESTQDGNTPPS